MLKSATHSQNQLTLKGTFLREFLFPARTSHFTDIDKSFYNQIIESFKTPGWTLLCGITDSGKSELLMAACQQLEMSQIESTDLHQSTSKPSLQIWLEMLPTLQCAKLSSPIEDPMSILAWQLGLRGSLIPELYTSLKYFLESLPHHSHIIIDHFDPVLCSEFIQIIDLFSSTLCITAIARNNQALNVALLDSRKIHVIHTPNTLDRFQALNLAAHLLNIECNIDAFEAEAVIGAAGGNPANIHCICSLLGQLPRHSLDSNLPLLPKTDYPEAFKPLLEVALTTSDRLLVGCINPLSYLEFVPFPQSLAWFLSMDVFLKLDENKSRRDAGLSSDTTPSIMWLNSWDRLVRIRWIRQCGPDAFRIAPPAILSDLVPIVSLNIISTSPYTEIVVPSAGSRWRLYYSFWASRWSASLTTASNLDVLPTATSQGEPITNSASSSSPTPLRVANMGRWAVSAGACRSALDDFDRWKRHHDKLLGLWDGFPASTPPLAYPTYSGKSPASTPPCSVSPPSSVSSALGSAAPPPSLPLLVGDRLEGGKGTADDGRLSAEDRVELAGLLAGKLHMFLSSRYPVDRSVAIARGIQSDCLQSGPVQLKVFANIDLGLQLLRSERTDEAVILFRSTIHTINDNNDRYSEVMEDGLGQPRETTDLELALASGGVSRLGPEFLACALSCLGMALPPSAEHEEETLLVLSDALEQWRLVERLGGNPVPEIVDALIELAGLLGSMKKFAKAEELLLEALEECSKLFGVSHLATAWAKRQLARLKQFEGLHKEAEPLFQGSLSVYLDHYGEGHVLEADILRELGHTYTALGRHYDAMKCLRRAMIVYRDVRGETDPILADILVETGLAVEAAGSIPRAVEAYREALDKLSSAYGDADIRVADAMFRLGSSLSQIEEYEEAKVLLERTLAIFQSTRGENDVLVGDTAAKLAEVYHATSQYVEAEDMYRKALLIFRAAGDLRHDDVGQVLVMMGRLFYDKEQYENSDEVLEEAMIVFRRLYGDSHVKVAEVCTILGSVYLDSDRPHQAEEVYERALKIRLKIQGNRPHPDVIAAHSDLANSYQTQGLFDKSRESYESALKLAIELYGENHAEVARIYNNMGTMSDDSGKLEDAYTNFEKAVEILKEVHGEAHPQIAITLCNIASLFEDEGSYEAAKKVLNEALFMYEELYGSEGDGEDGELEEVGNKVLHPAIKDIYDRLDAIKDKEKSSCVVS